MLASTSLMALRAHIGRRRKRRLRAPAAGEAGASAGPHGPGSLRSGVPGPRALASPTLHQLARIDVGVDPTESRRGDVPRVAARTGGRVTPDFGRERGIGQQPFDRVGEPVAGAVVDEESGATVL